MATPRWVEMYTTNSGSVGLSATWNAGHTLSHMKGRGLPPALRGSTPAEVPVTLTPVTSDLKITMNNGVSATSKTFTLISGTNLSPRVIARDITDKMHREYPVNDPIWTHAYCFWNYDAFEIRGGVCGLNASVSVDYTANSAADKLGFTHGVTANGSDNNRLYGGEPAADGKTTNTWSGTISVSGTCFAGSWDEYTIAAVNNDAGTAQGSASIVTHASGTYPGTVTLGGIYNYSEDTTYHVNVTVSGSASYMNGVLGAVPVLDWYGTGGDPTSYGSVELLYPNYPYPLGNKGLWIKFSNAPFSYPGDSWQILASGILAPSGYNYQWGSAMRTVIWSSLKGDTSWDITPNNGNTATYGNYFAIGRKGVYIAADQDYNVAAGDTLRVRVPGPVPYRYDVASVNLGNITVTTASRIFAMRFDLPAGAVELTNVKFSLLDDGGMGYHDGVNTAFRFGTVGEGQPAVTTSYDVEWRDGVVVTDLVPPTPEYLYSSVSNLAEVSTADDSQTIGISPFDGLISDYIFNAIQLGADESGQKTVVYRCYYDYTE